MTDFLPFAEQRVSFHLVGEEHQTSQVPRSSSPDVHSEEPAEARERLVQLMGEIPRMLPAPMCLRTGRESFPSFCFNAPRERSWGLMTV